jgi:hypothetical protein
MLGMIKKKAEKLREWANFTSRLFSYSLVLAILFMISKGTFNVPSNYHEIENYRGVLHHEIPIFILISAVPLLIISIRNGKFVRKMIFSQSFIKITFGVFFGLAASSIYFILGVLAYASALNHAYGEVVFVASIFVLLFALLCLFLVIDLADLMVNKLVED